MTEKNKRLAKLINRETVLYGIVGVGTSLLNIGLFQFLVYIKMDYRQANLLTLVIVKLAAYICNKNLVFQSHTGSLWGLTKEFVRFLIARGATMLIDYFGLIIMVEILDAGKLISKCIITAIVIIMNYFIGKKHVFKDCLQAERE